MPALVYPSSLPCPQTSTVTPAERRALSQADRPREARPLQRDRLEYERITWPPMDATQCAVLLEWWREILVYGGALFKASWPLPRGLVSAVRKFREQPRWVYVPGGFWRLSALCEVRGRGMDPRYDDGVVLLLHQDNVLEPTEFIDSSPLGHTVVTHGTAEQTSTPSKWGGGACHYDGNTSTSAWLQVASHPSLIFGTDDFTIEGWVYLTQPYGGGTSNPVPPNGRHILFATDATATAEYSLRVTIEPLDDLYPPTFGLLSCGINYAAGPPEAPHEGILRQFLVDTWYYWALTRSGATFELRLNGVLQVSWTNSNAIRDRGGDFLVGATGEGWEATRGYMDDFRVTHGLARDTSIVPTEPFES